MLNPDHNKPLREESEEHIFGILKAWQSRYLDLEKILESNIHSFKPWCRGWSFIISPPQPAHLNTFSSQNVIEEMEGMRRFYEKKAIAIFVKA